MGVQRSPAVERLLSEPPLGEHFYPQPREAYA